MEQFYDWLEHTLLPYAFPENAYNGDQLTPYERGFLADLTNYRIGPVRLRQLRTNQGTISRKPHKDGQYDR